MKGNRPKIHGNSPKNGQKMKQKRHLPKTEPLRSRKAVALPLKGEI